MAGFPADQSGGLPGMMLAQIKEVFTAIVEFANGRSEVFAAGLLLFLGSVAAIWWNYRIRKEAEAREDNREAERLKRDAEREKDRLDRDAEREAETRKLANRNADQLDVMCGALDRISKCMEVQTHTAERMEGAVQDLKIRQGKDRAAIGSIIDATEAHTRGEPDAVTEGIKRARRHLIEGIE